MKFKTLASAASVASVFAKHVRSESTELDDVRKAVIEHDAFMQRCVTDRWDETVAELKEAGEDPSEDFHDEFFRVQRNICGKTYDGINVCTTSGALKAISTITRYNSRVTKFLRDPPTRASDYKKVYLGMKELYAREIAALLALEAGQSSNCDVTDQ
ncbi:MAG: hypothetical protein OXF74_04755 [Rhodobacteraceae bacterium]|nr:hypothetical protein [Paracoccaceae bacterium]